MSDARGPAEPVDPLDRPDPPPPARRHRVTARPVRAATTTGRSPAGPRPHSPRPPHGPAQKTRARSRTGLAPVPVPTTVWTLPTADDTADDTASTDLPTGAHRAVHTGLPDRIHRVLTAFGHPATTLILTSPTDGEWIGPDGDLRASGHRSPADAPTGSAGGAQRGAQLIVLDLGCRGLDEHCAAAVAAHVAPGGTLAVLTHSHHAGGRLLDPTGAVIAALQDADLLYLQHVVIVEHPLRPQPEHPQPEHPQSEHPQSEHPQSEHTQPTVTNTDTAATRPGRGLVDLTLFLRPGAAV